jgi:hypothetical protein
MYETINNQTTYFIGAGVMALLAICTLIWGYRKKKAILLDIVGMTYDPDDEPYLDHHSTSNKYQSKTKKKRFFLSTKENIDIDYIENTDRLIGYTLLGNINGIPNSEYEFMIVNNLVYDISNPDYAMLTEHTREDVELWCNLINNRSNGMDRYKRLPKNYLYKVATANGIRVN